ncbi:hypothetical protein [Mollivirus kamchatka]|nr:hypothetical protein [Mollivirus kamchatka]
MSQQVCGNTSTASMLLSVDRCLHHARKAREAMQTCLDILDTIPVVDEVPNKIERSPSSLQNGSPKEEEEGARTVEIPKFDLAKLRPHYRTVIEAPAGRARTAIMQAIVKRGVAYDLSMAFVDSAKFMSSDLRQALKGVVEESNIVGGFNPVMLKDFVSKARENLATDPSARHLVAVHASRKLPRRFSKALVGLTMDLRSAAIDVVVATYPTEPNEVVLSRYATYLFLGGEPSEQNSAYLYGSQLVADAESSAAMQDLCMRDDGFLVVDMSSSKAVLSHAKAPLL